MKTNRLEAFSDGVMAIIITIMVLELDVPDESDFSSLLEIAPVFMSYLVSFIFIGIFWNNHHHLFQISEKVNGKVLWANLHLLFWLSLIPFSTAWVGKNHLASHPVMFYGFVLFMSGIAFNILIKTLLHSNQNNFALNKALGIRKKEKISLFTYAFAIGLSFFYPILGILCYILVAIMWFIPDKRIENQT